MPGKKLDTETKLEISRLLSEGESVRAVSKKLGVNRATVSKYGTLDVGHYWETKIIEQAKSQGVYFEQNIRLYRLLADLRTQYDACKRQYEEDGSKPIVTGTNKGGSEYKAKHPALALMLDLRKQEFDICARLGLLPELTSDKQIDPEQTKLDEILKAMKG